MKTTLLNVSVFIVCGLVQLWGSNKETYMATKTDLFHVFHLAAGHTK